jgi:hypothetical protein
MKSHESGCVFAEHVYGFVIGALSVAEAGQFTSHVVFVRELSQRRRNAVPRHGVIRAPAVRCAPALPIPVGSTARTD